MYFYIETQNSAQKKKTQLIQLISLYIIIIIYLSLSLKMSMCWASFWKKKKSTYIYINSLFY